MNKTLTYAHRGGSGYFVENTLKAFEFAIELGCDGAELDVQLSGDGEVIVHHDTRLNLRYARMRTGRWIDRHNVASINQLSLKELRSYNIGEPNPELHDKKVWPNILPVEGQKIPTLQEVIDLAKEKSDSFKLVVELKVDIFSTDPQAWRTLVDKVLAIVRLNGFSSRIAFCSFNWNALLYAKHCSPDIPLWFTTHPLSWLKTGEVPKSDISPKAGYLNKIRQAVATENAPWYAGLQPERNCDFAEVIEKAGGQAWFCYHSDVTVQTVERSRQKGIYLAAWSSGLVDAKALDSMAIADIICVDYPKRKYSIVDAKKESELSQFVTEAIKAKNWEKAILRGEIFFAFYPQYASATAYCKLAIAYRCKGYFFKSREMLNEGLKNYPNDVAMLIELGQLENAEKAWFSAFLIWKKVLSMLRGSIAQLNVDRMIKAFSHMDDSLYSDYSILIFLPILRRLKYNKEHFHYLRKLLAVIDLSSLKESDVSLLADELKEISLHEIVEIHNVSCADYNRFLLFEAAKAISNEMSRAETQKVLLESKEEISKNVCISLTPHLKDQFDYVLKKYGPENALSYIYGVYSFCKERGVSLYIWYYQHLVFNGCYSYAKNLKKELAIRFSEEQADSEFGKNIYEVAFSEFYNYKYDQLETAFERLKWRSWDDYKEKAWQAILFSRIAGGARPEDVFKSWHVVQHEINPNLSLVQTVELYGLDRMEKLVHNKNVLIIGPAELDPNIDAGSYDVVVGINLLPQDSAWRAKLDLVYYVSAVYNSDFKKINAKLAKSGAIPVFLRETDVSATRNIGGRKMTPCFKPFLSQQSFPHAVPRIIWDLLKFSPSKIMLTGVTFFMTGYNDSYLSSKTRSFKGYQQIKSVGHNHDPLQSFNFCKLLYDRGLIGFDRAGDDIINLDSSEYVDFLNTLNQKGFGKV